LTVIVKQPVSKPMMETMSWKHWTGRVRLGERSR
jgi:hypothetical protein